MAGTGPRASRIYIGLFLVALTTLLVEVLLTKIFDVILWPNFSFMIISSAMFGVGLGGLFEVVRPIPSDASASAAVSRSALLFGISVWALPLLLNGIPFSFRQAGYEPLAQLGWFLLLYLALLAPFFFGGLCICRLFAHAPGNIRTMYFWDLCGAAVGTASLIPLLPTLGPERLLLAAGVAALFASALFSTSRRWRLMLATVAGAFVVIPIWSGPHYMTLTLHENKRAVRTAIEHGRLEFSKWDPVSQIAVLDEPPTGRIPGDPGQKHVAYDGGTQSTNFFPFDGRFETLRQQLPGRLTHQFWQRGVLTSHYLRRDSGHSALIVGSAGGQETKAALMYGASDIDTVEMVGTVVDLATGRYADYIGRLFQHPNVHPHVGEGRSFLRGSHRTYDVIQVFSNYTSSSAAAGSGALMPVYLLTTEAFVEYFSHLKSDGILQINHHTYPRMIATAAAAWKAMDRDRFRSHVAVIERDSYNRAPDYLPTLLIKMTPWTPGELGDLRRFISFPAAGEPPYTLVENPLDPLSSFLPDEFYSGELSDATLRAAPYYVGPVTDDRPYFNFMHRSPSHLQPDRAAGLNASTAAFLNSQIRAGWLPTGWMHLLATSLAGVFYGLVFVLVPLCSSRVGREKWPGKASALLYFSLLGVSFIAIEILFIQIFMKLIGFPLYAVVTVLTVTLVGAGLGSMCSARIVGPDSSRWYLPFAGIIATGLVVWASYGPLSVHFMANDIGMRIAAASAMILPMAFFMGMPFPMGILELASKPRGAIAWAWSMNGLFSTVGGGLTVMLSVWLGFHATVGVALTLYASAAPVLARLRSTNRVRAQASEPRTAWVGSRSTILPACAGSYAETSTASSASRSTISSSFS